MTTYDFIASNKRKTVGLIFVFTALVLAIGWAADRYFQSNGTIFMIAGVYAIGSSLVGYYAGDKMALASSGAVRIEQKDNPYVYRMVENLCISVGMPMPKVHIIEDDAINAFACGRDPKHASIAVTTGAIRKLQNEELEGVIAHELSHVRNYDILVMTVVAVLAAVIAMIADMTLRSSLHGGRHRDSKDNGLAFVLLIVGIILAPLVANMIRLAVSRRREFLADSSGALMTRFPEGLARALKRIEADATPMSHVSSSTAHFFFSNPLSAEGISRLFSTHPPIADRVAALMTMGNVRS